MGSLQPVDIVIIVLHFCVVFGIGIWSTWGANKGSASGYFLAGRDMQWWLVGMSIFVSNIGSSSFIGLAGTAAASGYAVISYEFSGVTCLALLGFVFTPVYLSSGAYTMPEYMKKRYGGNRIRMYIAVVTLIFIVLSFISSEMYAGAIIIQQVLGWPLYPSVCLLLFLTAIYTVVGGLKAVIYTDALQTVFMFFGAIVLTILGFVKIGGMDNLHLEYMMAIPNTTHIWRNTTCGVPGEESFHIFRSAQDPSLPWPGVFFGIHILSGWYFCTNQVIVQRILSAKNVTHAKAGTIMAAYFKILPMYLMIFPGMISRALFPDEVACADPATCEAVCGVSAGCSNIAYPKLVLEIMPTGLRGLMMAAMLAALMSSLTSIFNSASTVFTIDIWLMIRKKASEADSGGFRLCTVGLVLVSVLWLPLIETYGSGELFVYIQSIASFFGPPLLAAFILAVFWTRANEQGAFWGLMSGFFIGFMRMILEFTFSPPSCTEVDSRPNIIKKFHYLHFACFLFGTTLLFTIVVSLLTKPIPLQKLNGMTWWTRHLRYSTCGDDTKEEKLQEEVKFARVLDKCAEKGNIELGENMGERREDASFTEKEMVENKSRNRENPSIKEKESLFSIFFLFVCGVSPKRLNFRESYVSYEDHQKEDSEGVSLYENPKWARVMNINVIILIGVGIFFFCFYA